MNVKYLAPAVVLMSLAASLPAQADLIPFQTPCEEPRKPLYYGSEFFTEWDAQRYQAAIDQYKACIEDFVESQESSIRMHGSAKERAINEWNSFVNRELR